jgi:Ni2+-binding GTPase involved in maturation of urease and hydrogenase
LFYDTFIFEEYSGPNTNPNLGPSFVAREKLIVYLKLFHDFINGAMGSGKTKTIHHLLPFIKKNYFHG